MDNIYGSHEEYQKNLFDPNDPALKRQEQYLETIDTEEWVALVDLYKEVKREGIPSKSFEVLQQKLYNLAIIFDFP